jgi:hypothetical protein
MIKAEFGIIECFDEHGNYTEYAPERYHCVAIDDDEYLNDWWDSLLEIDTLNVYNVQILQPQKALSRWGITIIPTNSLPKLLNIVVSDRRYRKDKRLASLAFLVRKAIKDGKYMIHYGV